MAIPVNNSYLLLMMRYFIFLLILGVIGGSLSSCKSSQPITEDNRGESGSDPITILRNDEQIKNLYVEASKEMVRGELQNAESLFQQVLEIDPANHAALYNLAKIAKEDNRLDRALNFAQQAVAEAPDNYWYRFLLRQIFEGRGEYNRAITTQEELLKRFPENPDDHLHLASLYVRQEQPRKALVSLNFLENEYGFQPTIALRKYEILNRLGDNEAALEVARNLVAFDERETQFYQLAYQQLMALGRTDEAVQLLEGLLEEDPENGFALLSLADYYKKTDQLERSDEYLFQAFENPDIDPEGKLEIIHGLMAYLDQEPELKPRITELIRIFQEVHPGTSGGYALQGQVLMATGQVDEARANYRRALELEPGNVGGWVDLIRLSLLAQDYATMLDDAEEARSYFPNQDQILFLYGFAAAREGLYRPAASALAKVIRMGTAEPALQAQAHSELAYVYHKQEDFAASAENYETAVQLAPGDPMIKNNYAAALAERGTQLDKAKQLAEQALDQAPNEAAFLHTLGWILLQQGDLKGARRQVDKALRSAPGNPEVLELSGDILFKQGDEAEAVAQWEKAIEAGADIDLDEKRRGGE